MSDKKHRFAAFVLLSATQKRFFYKKLREKRVKSGF